MPPPPCSSSRAQAPHPALLHLRGWGPWWASLPPQEKEGGKTPPKSVEDSHLSARGTAGRPVQGGGCPPQTAAPGRRGGAEPTAPGEEEGVLARDWSRPPSPWPPAPPGPSCLPPAPPCTLWGVPSRHPLPGLPPPRPWLAPMAAPAKALWQRLTSHEASWVPWVSRPPSASPPSQGCCEDGGRGMGAREARSGMSPASGPPPPRTPHPSHCACLASPAPPPEQEPQPTQKTIRTPDSLPVSTTWILRDCLFRMFSSGTAGWGRARGAATQDPGRGDPPPASPSLPRSCTELRGGGLISPASPPRGPKGGATAKWRHRLLQGPSCSPLPWTGVCLGEPWPPPSLKQPRSLLRVLLPPSPSSPGVPKLPRNWPPRFPQSPLPS